MPDVISEAWDALRQVYDPEAGISIVDLGLIYDIEVQDGVVTLRMTFTTEACPAGPILKHSAATALRALPGVREVRIEITFDPPWTPDRITPDGRAMLGS